MDIIARRKAKILRFMKEDSYRPLKFQELAIVLDVPQEDIDIFESLLLELVREGKIHKTRKGRYGASGRMSLYSGKIQANERGYAFFIHDEEGFKDIFIPGEMLNGAMHNDRVLVRINTAGVREKRPEGEVIRILERANKTIVGTFELSRHFGFVIPDDKKLVRDIFIPKEEIKGAKTGQKVVVEITLWPEKRRNAEGRIIEILGHKDEPGADILSILRAFKLKEVFPGEVLKQAGEAVQEVTGEMAEGRKDLRNITMVTIDGEDAKDLDDAVSIQKLENGNYRLGVHIADVSYYVKENEPLDIEALERGTSVYLVDRVIPMLPKSLSNGICSLNPGVDRLAFTVMMEIDHSGRVLDNEIFESVININERMTYTDVYKILEKNEEYLFKRYDGLIDKFYLMKELAVILRKKRMSRGAIDFDFDEAKVILDDEGKPVEVKRYEITIANKIIEEFMLVCNETVAEQFYWIGIPFVYRVHEEPEQEKMEKFSEFTYNLGYPLKGINSIHPGMLQELLEKVKGTKEEMIVSTVMLRSLQKARYSHLNDGHFGLAARFYCHFTSPIRRYPDLVIHRIMKEYLKGDMDEDRIDELKTRLAEITRICSEREKDAEEAERATVDLKKVEFMRDKVGEEFDGVISSVTSFGMFIELDNTIEGLVRVGDLDDDYYIYNEKQYSLIGERTKKAYRIGGQVKVLVARADLDTRQIDFVLVKDNDKINGSKSSKPVRKARPKQKRKRKVKA